MTSETHNNTIEYSITQSGKTLSKDKYTIDFKNKTISTPENNLVLDFSGVNGWSFTTGDECTFTTGDECTFTTGDECTFTTGPYCVFTTGSYCVFTTDSYCVSTTGSNCSFTTGYNCTFTTGSDCTFTTGSDCTFTTYSDCVFKTYSDCTFTTGSNCTFKTGSDCTFKTGYDCVFKTGDECACIRRDIYEIIEIPKNTLIKLNEYQVKGYSIIAPTNATKTITIDNNSLEISLESFDNLKQFFLNT